MYTSARRSCSKATSFINEVEVFAMPISSLLRNKEIMTPFFSSSSSPILGMDEHQMAHATQS